MTDPNPAIREIASESMVIALPAADLRALRHMLKAPDLRVRVLAASRILELLR